MVFLLTLLALFFGSRAVDIDFCSGATCSGCSSMTINECNLSPVTGCWSKAICKCVGNGQRKIRGYYYPSTDTTCSGAPHGNVEIMVNGKCNEIVGQCADDVEFTVNAKISVAEWDEKCDMACP
eukprot:159459_1